jgi:hypothetical protein
MGTMSNRLRYWSLNVVDAVVSLLPVLGIKGPLIKRNTQSSRS